MKCRMCGEEKERTDFGICKGCLDIIDRKEKKGMKFRKKPIIITATQWFKNGDHPQDDCFRPFEDTGKIPIEPREGKVVRYFRHPDVNGMDICSKCGRAMYVHGWIDTLEDGHNVCPSDWIVTGTRGEFYPVKDYIFRDIYEGINGEDLH